MLEESKIELLDMMQHCQTFQIERKEEQLRGELSLVAASINDLEYLSKQFLSPDEQAYYRTLVYDRRKQGYLLGRYCAKLAISRLHKLSDLTKIGIANGVFQQPLIHSSCVNNTTISYSHCNEICIALAFPEACPMGIDVEEISDHSASVLKELLTEDEKSLLSSINGIRKNATFTMLWTIKEAISKALRTGLTAPFNIFSIKDLRYHHGSWINEFDNFAQYRAVSFFLGNHACSVVYPKQFEHGIDIFSLQEMFEIKNP